MEIFSKKNVIQKSWSAKFFSSASHQTRRQVSATVHFLITSVKYQLVVKTFHTETVLELMTPCMGVFRGFMGSNPHDFSTSKNTKTVVKSNPSNLFLATSLYDTAIDN